MNEMMLIVTNNRLMWMPYLHIYFAVTLLFPHHMHLDANPLNEIPSPLFAYVIYE